MIVGGLGKHTLKVGNGRNILVDGTVQLAKANDTLALVLSDWSSKGSVPTNVADIRSRLRVTNNTANANTLLAGTGLDWFWGTDNLDTTNKKSTDLLN